MENIMLHRKLLRGVREVSITYMVYHHIKVAHIPPEHDTYLNLDEKIIARAPIVNGKLNIKLTQDILNRAYSDHQCGTFKIDNPLVYQTLFKNFMDMSAYIG